jgi:hypothetical protein
MSVNVGGVCWCKLHVPLISIVEWKGKHFAHYLAWSKENWYCTQLFYHTWMLLIFECTLNTVVVRCIKRAYNKYLMLGRLDSVYKHILLKYYCVIKARDWKWPSSRFCLYRSSVDRLTYLSHSLISNSNPHHLPSDIIMFSCWLSILFKSLMTLKNLSFVRWRKNPGKVHATNSWIARKDLRTLEFPLGINRSSSTMTPP